MLEMVPPNGHFGKRNDLLGLRRQRLFSDFLNMPFDLGDNKLGGYGLHKCKP